MLSILFCAENVSYAIPAIPRLLTAIAEWGGVTALLILLHKRFDPLQTGILLALGLPVQILLRCGYSGELEMPVFWLFMAVNLGFMFGMLRLLSDEPLRVIIISWVNAFVFAELSASLCWEIMDFLFDAPTLGRPGGFLLAFLLTVGGQVLHFYSKYRRGRKIPIMEWPYVILVMGIAALTFSVSNLAVFNFTLWKYGTRNTVIDRLIAAVRTICDFSGAALLSVIYRLYSEQQMRQNLAVMQQLIESQYQQYLDFRENSEYIRRQCHDLKHQIDIIRASGKNDRTEQYLKEMEEMIEGYREQCDTGNPVLDTILTQKMRICRANNITLTYTVEKMCLSSVDPRDISTLFGNLIDNAIEATASLPENERLIQLELTRKNTFCMIRVENRYAAEPDFRDGLPLTTKDDRQLHGIGVQSVRYIAEKYAGSATFHAENGWFTAGVLLVLPA